MRRPSFHLDLDIVDIRRGDRDPAGRVGPVEDQAFASSDPVPVQMVYAVEVRLFLAREDEFKRPDAPSLTNGLFCNGDRGRP